MIPILTRLMYSSSSQDDDDDDKDDDNNGELPFRSEVNGLLVEFEPPPKRPTARLASNMVPHSDLRKMLDERQNGKNSW